MGVGWIERGSKSFDEITESTILRDMPINLTGCQVPSFMQGRKWKESQPYHLTDTRQNTFPEWKFSVMAFGSESQRLGEEEILLLKTLSISCSVFLRK